MGLPDWAEKIRRAMSQLGETQEAFAQHLGVSPATLSRWVNGKNEPTPAMYVALGNLVGKPDRNYFFSRAGIEILGTSEEATGGRHLQSLRLGESDYQLVNRKKISGRLTSRGKIVGIPLLSVPLYADEKAPPETVNLADARVEDVLTASIDWCPHPDALLAMRVHGDSMVPIITPGDIVIVDTSSNDRNTLDRKIVVISHRDLGFKVARLQRIANAYLLVSANHKCFPIDVSNAAKWKLFGEVLWWISLENVPAKYEGVK